MKDLLHGKKRLLQRGGLRVFGGSILPLSIDFSALADGALPSTLVGPTWSVSGGSAVNTPSTGDNLFSNPGFDDGSAWNLDTDWSIGSGVASKAAGAATRVLNQSVLTAKRLYIAEWDLATVDTGSPSFYFGATSSLGIPRSAPGSFVDVQLSGAAAAAGIRGAATAVCSVDNLNIKLLTPSSLFAVVDARRSGCTVSAIPSTIVSGASCGVVACLDSETSPLNCVVGVHRGTGSAVLLKCVNGDWSLVLEVTVAYVAGAEIAVVQNAPGSSTFSLYYNGLRLGAPQTISDAGIINNTLYGLFSPHNGDAFESLTVAATDELDTVYATHAAAPLTTPTYDGSGAAIHPDVYDAGSGNTWSGKRYWMAVTPYFNADQNYENPSILCSDDGETWAAPDGLTNPIEPDPATGFYADSDLIVVGGVAYYHYIYGEATQETLKRLQSVDGVTWAEEADVIVGALSSMRSPAVVAYGNGFLMFYNSGASAPYSLKMRSASSVTGAWSEETTCTLSTPLTQGAWHLDVINDGGTLYGLFQMQDTGDLYIARSTDGGASWTVRKNPALKRVGAPAWAAGGLYRGSIIRTVIGFDCFYSGIESGAIGGGVQWNVGRASIVMS